LIPTSSSSSSSRGACLAVHPSARRFATVDAAAVAVCVWDLDYNRCIGMWCECFCHVHLCSL
jgi:hypothetical protein